MNWKSWLKRSSWERKMDTEFRFHLATLTSEYIKQGFSPEEAERMARREFGPTDLAKDECRDERPDAWLSTFWRDIRYACRSLGKSKAFAAAVVITLALGIGANTAVFSIVHAMLLKPLPYAEPGQIYSVEVVMPERRDQIPSLPATVQAYLEWRRSQNAFLDITALRPWECSLTGDGEPERLGGARVSTNFFSFLGVPVAAGRGFETGEEKPGNDRVVVISSGLWQRRYASDPHLIGKSIVINGESHRVIGIAPASLLVPTGTMLHALLPFGPRVDIWKPIAPTNKELENESWDHGVLVRLGPGASFAAGQQQLRNILMALIRTYAPNLRTEFSVQLLPIREVYSGKTRLRLLLLMAASLLLLLTACANIANLFMSRMASRAAEFATRIALGAGRARILSQSLTETTLLALIGGVMGAGMAQFGAGLMVVYAPDEIRALTRAEVDPQVLLFALAASLITGILCGMVPAWQSYQQNSTAGLRQGSRASAAIQSVRLRRVLVGVQMALGTALVASSGLLLHSFIKVLGADRGYQIERILAADISLSGQRYAAPEQRIGFFKELVARIRALPGVQAAAAISGLPAVAGTSGPSRTIFHPDDTDFASTVMSRPVALIRSVTDGYFAASGTSLRAGRFLVEREDTLAAVVSEGLAKRLWPGEAAHSMIGRRIRQGDVKGPLISIVGVVQDVLPGAVDRDPSPILYRPHPQWASGPMTLVIKTAGDPASIGPAVRSEIRSQDPNLPIQSIRTMRELVHGTVAQRQFQLILILLFAGLSLLLGAVGLYGVVSYSVVCRTRDIGLRIALGSSRAGVLLWVFSTGMQPVAAGMLAGLAGAVAIATAARNLLYGIGPGDPLTLAGVVLVLMASACAACYLPARRAASLDPITALRHE